MKGLSSLAIRFTWLLAFGYAAWHARQAVLAFEPDPNVWFVETVSFEPADLPPDFHIYTGESSPEQLAEGVWLSTNTPDTSLQAMITLINRSEEPVYILSLEYMDRLIMATPDEAFGARLRAAHEVASYLVRPNSGEVFALTWEAMVDLDDALKDVNLPVFEAPPAGLTPPEPQHSELLMVYGEQVILLPFTVSYAINENFSMEGSPGPAGVAEPTEAPAEPRGIAAIDPFVLLVIGIGSVILIAWAILQWRWRR
jgi:hypothetical protein